MSPKPGISLFILVLGWISLNARSLVAADIIAVPIRYDPQGSENKWPNAVRKKDQLCTVCEEFTAEAAAFLGENKTQAEILDTFHKACSRMQSLEEQCIILVDYYANIFFLEVSHIRPEEFCHKVNLCGNEYIAFPKGNDTCNLCHQVVVEVLTRLKDPDAQIEIIEILLKECNKLERHAKECKRLVFHYGPLILANAEKFLERTDVCSFLHACSSGKDEAVKSARNAATLLADT